MEIIIVGKETCPDCERAKEAVKLINLDYINVNINTMESDSIIIDLKKTGTKLPYVFINSKYIGGYQKLCAFLNNYEVQNNLNLDNF